MSDEAQREPIRAENVRAVRSGHGANCSSIGSVIDALFVTSVVGGAIFAAVVAAMKQESLGPVRVVGEAAPRKADVPDGAPTERD